VSVPREVYTHGHHESVLASHRWRSAQNSAAYLLPALEPDAQVLDVGCGPGSITIDLAARVPGGHVVGLDVAPDVVDAARAAAVEQGVRNVTFGTGDVYDLQLADDSFDVVHAHQVLQHLSDPVAALGELRRVCRPGGIVAARDADYEAMTWFPEEPALERWRALYRALSRANGGEPDAGRRLTSWANRAGFSEVHSSASAWCFADGPTRAWWAGTWAERITRSSFAERATALGLADGDELAALAEGWRRWAAEPDGWFAVLHGEVLCRP
jgi:ubiquinone/menaquinone biosynthesis C-methylase UbiE